MKIQSIQKLAWRILLAAILVVTALVPALASAQVHIQSLDLPSRELISGNDYVATVTLSGPAPSGGANVLLSYAPGTSMDGIYALNLPANVQVPQGLTSATFHFSSKPTEAYVYGEISASYFGTCTERTNVNIVSVREIVTDSTYIVGGNTFNVTLIFSGSTPYVRNHDVEIDYPDSPDIFTITVPANAKQYTFSAVSHSFASNTMVQMQIGSRGAPGYQDADTLYLDIRPAGTVTQFTISTNSIVGGNNVFLVATLDGPAPPSGTTIPLNNNGFTDLNLPTSLYVRPGRTWDAVSFNPKGVDQVVHATFSGGLSGGTSFPFTLDIKPASFISLGFSPSTQVGGTAASGVAKLDGAAGPSGITINVFSHHAILSVPPTVVIPSQAKSKAFAAQTLGVNSTTAATATGTYGAISLNAGITIQKATLLTFTGPTSLVHNANGTYTIRLNGKAGNLGTVYTIQYVGATGPATAKVLASGIAFAFVAKATGPSGSTMSVKVTGPTGDTQTVNVPIN